MFEPVPDARSNSCAGALVIVSAITRVSVSDRAAASVGSRNASHSASASVIGLQASEHRAHFSYRMFPGRQAIPHSASAFGETYPQRHVVDDAREHLGQRLGVSGRNQKAGFLADELRDRSD